MKESLKNMLRYMGMPYQKVDEKLRKEVERAYTEIKALAKPKSVCQAFRINQREETVTFEGTNFSIHSYDLAKLFKDCKKAYMLAVTLGFDVDQRVNYLQRNQMSVAMMWDAAASVLIEEFCDELQEELKGQLQPNEYFTMRYSPGYGDVPIDIQTQVLHILNATRRMGLMTTKSHMLLPKKSITAFLGVSSKPQESRETCTRCNLRENCQYKKRGESCGK